MDKAGYIAALPLSGLCRGGRLPVRGAVLDDPRARVARRPTGSVVPPSAASRGSLIQHAARATFGDRDFVVLNAFALGPWATGMSVTMALAERYLVKSIGPEQASSSTTLELLGPRRPYLSAVIHRF